MEFAIGLIALYFVPTIVACSRKHHNTMDIVLLNILLGWTLLGWIASLIWAATAVQQPAKMVA